MSFYHVSPKVQIIDRQTPDYYLFRSVDVSVGNQMVSGGPQRLSGINQLCAHVPDMKTTTTVYNLPCSPGPINGKCF